VHLAIAAPLLGSWALLALLLGVGVFVCLTLPRSRRILYIYAAREHRSVLSLAWLFSLVATLGSLYFSEIVGFVPCLLCWYQRIAMYPLVIILGVAAVRGDAGVARYAGPLAFIGALVSIWHIGVERIPGLPSGSCSLETPCSAILVQVVGFITIPTMALAGFLAILTLLLLTRSSGTEPEVESPS
jgi:disulfide bond formation protein DsbB